MLPLLALLAIAAPKPDAVAAHREALRLKKEGLIADAIRELEKATRLSPDFAEAWAELGNVHLAQQTYEDAILSFEQALKVDAGYAVARYNLAFSLRKMKRFDKAAEQYRLYIQARPADADAHYGLAEALRALGDTEAAADAYESYARTEKNPAQTKWVEKARETAAELRKAASAEKKVAKVEPVAPRPKAKEPKAIDAKGTVHLSFSDPPPKADPPAKPDPAPALDPVPVAEAKGKRPDAFTAGLQHLQNGDYATALQRLESASRELPDDGLTLAALAAAHLGLEHGAEAEGLYLRAIAAGTEDALPGLYLGLGEARRLLGKNAEAVAAYETAKGHERATSSIKRFSEERIAALR
jgi:tetratricopeptide (TPR) repeat protein